MQQVKGFVIAAAVIMGLVQCRQINQPRSFEDKIEMDGMEQAMLQEFMMTKDPNLNYIPTERLVAAKAYMESLVSTNRVNALAWTERGPNNIGGRTRAILVDKRDATGNTVFAASVSGGLFKTTNFTNATPTWAAVNDLLPNLAITCLVQDNTNQDIMYAGTGEGWFNIDAVRGRGIYKSTDGGISWNVLPATIKITPADSVYEYVQDLVIDNNGAVYASLRNTIGFSRGVKRSVDGGTTWTQVLGLPLPGFVTGRATDLEVASNGDVYACLGIFGPGSIWKSSFAVNGANTGAPGTWAEVTPPWQKERFRIELAIAASNPLRLYAVGQDGDNDQVIGLWRSFNGGGSWDSVGSPSEFNNGSFSQTWYNMTMAVDPNNPDILVAGGLDLARSTNAGVNWARIANGVHVDHHALVYVNSTRLLNGNDGGIYYSTDAGSTFGNRNSGYNVTQYYACDLHPSNTNYFLAGAQDNGTHKFTTAGINSVSSVVGGDGGFCHIRQTDGQLQIAATTANNYYRSTNGGGSFSSLGGINNSRGQFINPTDLDDNTAILYCGDDGGQYYVITGLTATPASLIAAVPAMGNRELTAVKVDPFTANTIWVGASKTDPPTNTPMVLKITNANTASPTVLSSNIISVASGANISSVDVDPANPNHILVTFSNYGIVSVWESINGGTSFSPIEGNLPDMPVRWGFFAPANAELNGAGNGLGGILLGTELGVWTTSQINGSSTQWIPNNGGLANVRTDMLKWKPSDNTVAAATHGRGLFTTILPTVVTGLPPDPNTKNFIKYSFVDHNNLQIVIGNLQTRTIAIQITDMKGSLVLSSNGPYQNTMINLGRLQSGSYIIRITGNNKESFVKQFVK